MKNNSDKKIFITTGDFNGIGAEIVIKALNKLNLPSKNVVLISNKKILDFYGGLNNDYDIIEVPFEGGIEPKKLCDKSGEFSFKSLKIACELVKKEQNCAIVTAPVAKNALYLAGHKFNGQTEVLESFLAHDLQHAEMLFVADDFRVLLLTRHCAINQINLNEKIIIDKIINLDKFFKTQYCISSPRFALCGFNPHAGEDGILGNEENDILIPAVKKLNQLGINITMPKPADALFMQAGKYYLNNDKMPYDCYISNYHDQGLVAIKSIAQDKCVNMTIGLDVIRTSPVHGTAFDIAGDDIADETSMIEAIKAVL
ncbi:MAG: 4-hydroxythreonine-4-phosphate dehydrogenase PdxA [Candidatus Gastranaerophilales bacterium]